jgi:hypothetical protein
LLSSRALSRLAPATILLAALLPAVGYALAARWLGALLCLIVGAAWFAGARGNLGWATAAGFLLLVGLAGFGALTGVPPGWGLAGVVATLAAWDLSAFAGRLARAGRVVDEPALWQAHLRRLAATLGIGAVLGVLPLLVRLELSFGWLLTLGIVAVVALSRAIRTSS